MLEDYKKHVSERIKLGIPPKPINAKQMIELSKLIKNPPNGIEKYLLNLLINRVPPGVDEAAYVKASLLSSIMKREISSHLITPIQAIKLLGTMQGGYSLSPLIEALDNSIIAPFAVKAIKNMILIFDDFYNIEEKYKSGNFFAKEIISSWAKSEWFFSRSPLPYKITVTVFKVTGETNTDDLSPATDAWSRTDIPLHALSMLKYCRDGIYPNEPGKVGPINQINKLKKIGYPLAYVGDVVGTGSSRKSATNSILWFIGNDIPYIPNKRTGGIIIGGKIAPIFFNTMRDSGAFPIETDTSCMKMGDIIDIYPYYGKIFCHQTKKFISSFNIQPNSLINEIQAGGRISFILSRILSERSRESLGLSKLNNFHAEEKNSVKHSKGFTLAQKIVGRACGEKGIKPGQYCEPKMTSVGSQDTTGPMTRDELKDLACLGFSADLVLQSFCHTAAYPKPIDILNHNTLPDFIMNRGGISLKPGDGIIHSWLNRMLIPDTVGTGGDSHTRFPIGISFPAGSGLVAFSAATGMMPLEMPESVLVRFTGKINFGITIRDLVHAIPYYAVKKGWLSIGKENKKNIFSGRILEIEGLPNLKVEQAFELSDASAERSAAGCTIKLNKEPIIEYLNSNIVLLKWMITQGYQDSRSLERRIKKMEDWIDNPNLLVADRDARYVDIMEIDLSDIVEPILCIPNDPDNTKLLSKLSGIEVDEIFIGSCMTNIGHFRAAGNILKNFNKKLSKKLWIAPPTKMDFLQLEEEGYYRIFKQVGARTEIPGCSLCMGNQARVQDNATVVSTSTRNFPNRLGNNANVYLSSSEIAAITAILGYLPSVKEYMKFIKKIEKKSKDIYKYLNFNLISKYLKSENDVFFKTLI